MILGAFLSMLGVLVGFYHSRQDSSQTTFRFSAALQDPNPARQEENPPWWKERVFYHVYLPSFQDSNGDGVGDLRGLTQRLSYLKSLGIGAVWISSIHPSSEDDFGHDVTDYYGIHPKLGTWSDFKDLMAEAKKCDLKIVLDLLVNHTSRLHPWFIEARRSKQSPKRDWYLWRDQPNNWISRLDESVWEYDSGSHQYYLHSFFREQPDLNWRNSAVVDEVLEIMKFWLKNGVEGFRLDLANCYLKEKHLKNNPSTFLSMRWVQSFFYRYWSQEHSNDRDRWEELQGIFLQVRHLTDEYNAVLLAENDVDFGEGLYAASQLRGLKGEGVPLAFDSDLWSLNLGAQAFQEKWTEIETSSSSSDWPINSFSHQNRVRHYTRFGNSDEKARLAAFLLMTMRGTPVVYYGEEIGIREGEGHWEEGPDPLHRIMSKAAWFRYWTGSPYIPLKRQESRTPMQWETREYKGFSSHAPWIPFSSATDSVEEQSDDYRDSIYWLYRKLIYFRTQSAALRLGNQKIHSTANPNLLLISRSYEQNTVWVLFNFGSQTIQLQHEQEASVLICSSSTCTSEEVEPWSGLALSYQ
ncbi:MAG: hypothetical protein I8H75_01405 [Myxococcaceae bacterium]|nr:hypothetical protein [Myxococcaceae bacterium]MBH2005997.1 hypothetical protein [Myxococcaceae bacterium]